MLAHEAGDLLVGDDAGAFCVYGDVDRLGHTNGIADLDLALACQAGRDDVLGHVSGGIGSRAIDLGRVLARERTTAMRAGTAICINNDFARSEEHTSELQSLMRISYAVFCLKKKK